MELEKTIIKKVYDEYLPKDHSYGTLDSTNLNPKREVQLDKLERIAQKLQQISDDIVRKKLTPKETTSWSLTGAMGPESIPLGIPIAKQAAISNTGGSGFLLFDTIPDGPLDTSIERLMAQFPISRLLDGLDGPLTLDCDEVLKMYGFSPDGGGEEGGNSDTDDGQQSSSSESSSDTEEDDDTETESSSGEIDLASQYEACAEIELEWLKLILILVRVIQTIRTIIDLVISLTLPILDILALAIGAWLNPPNIAIIAMKVMTVITGIVSMLIALILQSIWNLLNLDCVCDQTEQVMAQIAKALSAFSNIMSVFSPNSVNLIVGKVNDEIMDPLNDLATKLQDKKDAWSAAEDAYKSVFSLNTLKEIGNAAKNAAVTGVTGSYQFGKAASLYNQFSQLISGPMSEVVDSAKSVSNLFKKESYTNSSAAQTKAASMLLSAKLAYVFTSSKKL